ncbi:unnamed protein product [Bursaphelenchus okinawaensis]|uniref:F-box domain-containing protein n=1 Tax=Bursaphelenchus okinawaensis TaxID=465554 RepID=A0A811LMX3_9BILA|nr:unnamed protein product [Bursaphelenchus okinawaensis]CAG9125726.1 unnamed protein product [Bursaphelenchus okinawaensis]
MDKWLTKLPKKLWKDIFDHIEGIESLAAIASSHRSFYKWINRDFRRLCYREGIYRFQGESWANAFSLTTYRAFDLNGLSYELIDFKQHFEESMKRILIANKGTRLIINCKTKETEQIAYLYDISSKQVLRKFETTNFYYGLYLQVNDNNTIYDPFTNREFEIPSGMRFAGGKSVGITKDRYGEHRYIPLFARLQEELYIKEMKTDQVFKLGNVNKYFMYCILEESGLIYIYNYSCGGNGYNKIQLYDIKTQEKVYERWYNPYKDDWIIFSNHAIYNSETGEYVIYDPKKKQFYSRFINCHHPNSKQYIPQKKVCSFTSLGRADGRRRFDWCNAHEEKSTFFFDYNKGNLKLMPICVDETAFVAEICNQCETFLIERQEAGLDSATLADEFKQFFMSQLQLLVTRPAIPEVKRFIADGCPLMPIKKLTSSLCSY